PPWLDHKATLRRVAELAVPAIADVAIAFLVHGDEIGAIEMAAVDPERAASIRHLIERQADALDMERGVQRLTDASQPVLIADLSASSSTASALLRGTGFESLVVVPIRSGDDVVGML